MWSKELKHNKQLRNHYQSVGKKYELQRRLQQEWVKEKYEEAISFR